ncbi:hypothetical protein CVT24_002860 [Panaeolus cyanescens]|uniref:Uncharacterized protein n=1 Tax=Panaeolus cyanescens TaxID=181874 RepID=A0A409X3W3_9AGAR|nr:hypothetical protein CVT24_002860 [Panaeolus cyanescens]
MDSEYAHLFANNFPPNLLLSRIGLSNLLSYMGTGQGSGTKRFLSNLATNRPNKFFFSSLSDITQVFEVAFQRNVTTYGHSLNRGYLAKAAAGCFDICVWGQPNKILGLQPDGRDNDAGVRAKFEPYWAETVQEAWSNFLGPLLDGDLTTILPEQKRAWKDAYNFLIGLQIFGFESGLTVFQCANNLSLAGLCHQPTVKDVAQWMSFSSGKHLGAQKALYGPLGFQADGTPTQSIYAIFYGLWKYLDIHLTDQDKADLGFGAMFLEHVLCKVERYDKRWPGEFLERSKNVEKENRPWIPGENTTNGDAFPFPLTIDRQAFQEILDSIKNN